MARRADAKNALPTAIDTSAMSLAAAQGLQVPVGGGAARGGALGTPLQGPQQTHLPQSVQAKLLLLQGKLLRRDRTFLTWKWRDFYLEQHRLQYFSEKGVRKGEIVITSTTPIMIRLLSEPKPFGFLVFIKDEKLTLAAATAHDRQKWIDVFTEVFHANVEDFQTSKAAAATAPGEKPEKKRTRPTFLPIPDMSEDEGGHSGHHLHAMGASGAKTPVGGAGGSSLVMTPGEGGGAEMTATRTSLMGRLSEGTVAVVSATAAGGETTTTAAASAASAKTPTTTTTAATATPTAAAPTPSTPTRAAPIVTATAPGATATTTTKAPSQHELHERRHLFRRNSDGVVAVEGGVPRSKFIALKEHYSSVTFPRSLANGDVLVGVGPLVRRMGWTDERILAVGLYIDADAAAKESHRFYGRSLKSLRGDQAFYDFLSQHSKFRRSFVVTSRKRVSKSVLIALLHDEIAPRVSGSTEALHTFLGFIEKSLRKAESMMLRIHPDGGRLEFRLRGQQYPPIASSMLCQCIQSVFFDVNSIQQDAKRRLVDRFPLLWGIEESDEALRALGNSDRDWQGHELEPRDDGVISESEDDDDDDDYASDEYASDERPRASTSADDQGHPLRKLSIKEKLNELDEREHELMRRESRSLGVHFGPIVDKDSNVLFRGDLLVDGSALLGTWSQKISFLDDAVTSAPPVSPRAAAPGLTSQTSFHERSCVVSVGLYAEPGGASEALLKYKGLSVGSILQDMDFFARFADGLFTKHLVFKVEESMSVAKLVDYFTARVRRRGSGAGAPGSSDSGRSSDAKVRALLDKLDEAGVGKLRPDDELQVTISGDSRMTLTITRQVTGDDGSNESEYPPVDGVKIAAAPFSTIFQGIFYGYHTLEPASRAQLMERLPSLLDLAKDDLAHTYHDEIQVLKENYKRQLPEFRLKAGYMLISFEKKKVAKNADGIKEEMIMASKWSKRWCRLDGTTFSYFSHKRSKKPRDIIDLTQCVVSEINSSSMSVELAPFAVDKGARPSIRIGIAKRMNGEIIALKTESIYEGVEWLESLVEASNVVRKMVQSTFDNEEMEPTTIETSGDGDADESSGVLDGEFDDGDATNGDQYIPEQRIVQEDLPPAAQYAHRAELTSTAAVVVDKHGSLLSWIREDSRHAFIFALLLAIAWLVTSQEPVVIVRGAVSGLDTNSTLMASSPATGGL